jgi:hypothetical protein
LELKMMSYGKAIEHDHGQVGAIERAVEGEEEARRAHVRDESGAEHGEDAERRPMAATSHQEHSSRCDCMMDPSSERMWEQATSSPAALKLRHLFAAAAYSRGAPTVWKAM